MNQNENPQNIVFQALDAVPSQLWYILGIGSIVASMTFQAMGKKNWADFVGKWPPTFLLIGLYHKLLRPGNEDATGQASRAARQFGEVGDQFGR
jgi:hypothetical protein